MTKVARNNKIVCVIKTPPPYSKGRCEIIRSQRGGALCVPTLLATTSQRTRGRPLRASSLRHALLRRHTTRRLPSMSCSTTQSSPATPCSQASSRSPREVQRFSVEARAKILSPASACGTASLPEKLARFANPQMRHAHTARSPRGQRFCQSRVRETRTPILCTPCR